MIVPQEIVEKFNKIKSLIKEKEEIAEDIHRFLEENGIDEGLLFIDCVEIVKEPRGIYKGNDVWVNEWQAYEHEDWHQGYFYLKTCNGDFLEIYFDNLGEIE